MRKTGILAAAALAVFTMISCSGDMHDSDESTKATILLSLQDQKITLPKDFIFYEDWWISGTTGTYGDFSFTAAKIEIDDGGYYSKLTLTLSDGTSKELYNENPKTAQYTLECEMNFSTNGATASSLSFNGDKNYK